MFRRAAGHTQRVRRWRWLLAGLWIGCASGDEPATTAVTTFAPTATSTTPATTGPATSSGSSDDSDAGSNPETSDATGDTGEGTSNNPSSDTGIEGTSGEASSSGAVPSEQPENGMYSSCDSIADCVGLTACLTATDTSGQAIDAFCTAGACDSPLAQCDPTPGGTAVPICLPTDAMDNVCALDCAQGQECPDGMDCRTLAGGSICS